MVNEMQLLHVGQVALVDRRSLDVLVAENYRGEENISIFKRFTMPCSEVKKGCEILAKLGYDAARIFPGYSGVAEHLLNQHKYS